MFEAFLNYASKITIWQFEYRATPHIQGEFLQLGVTRPRKFVGQGSRRKAKVSAKSCSESFQESCGLRPARWFQLGPYLESPPRSAVKKFTVVRGTYKDNVRRKPVYLQQ